MSTVATKKGGKGGKQAAEVTTNPTEDQLEPMGNFGEKVIATLKNGLNMLVYGKHGIGKTHTVLEACEKLGLTVAYYSVPTMEPWVDFIGIPKVIDQDGEQYLELIRPKNLAHNEVDVLIFDEVNRGDAKVRNAIMELIQFKTINGRKFDRIKSVIAMANPDNDVENYDTDRLDKAFITRFHVKAYLPDTINHAYFERKYGKHYADCAAEFYQMVVSRGDNAKNELSPRCLDYALHVYTSCPGLTIHDVIPQSCNPEHFHQMLKEGGVTLTWDGTYEIYRDNNAEPSSEAYDRLEAFGATVEQNPDKFMQWMCHDLGQFRWGIFFYLHPTCGLREHFASYYSRALNKKYRGDRDRDMLEKLVAFLDACQKEVDGHGEVKTYFHIDEFKKEFHEKKYRIQD